MKIKVAFVVAVLLLGACSNSSKAQDPEELEAEYPTDPNALILRIGQEGGFVPVQFNLTRLPALALYGDGRLISQGPQILIFPGPALPNLLVRRVSAEGIKAIVDEAVKAGLTGQDRVYRAAADRVTDLPDTVFTLVTGSRHQTSVYGFGVGEDLSAGSTEEKTAVTALHKLQDRLTDLSWLPEGSVGDEEAFDATEMRIFVSEPVRTDPGMEQAPVDWPLARPLAEFGAPTLPEGFRCGTVSGDDLTKVLETAKTANQVTPWGSAGIKYGLSFRPLLPDESGCPEV